MADRFIAVTRKRDQVEVLMNIRHINLIEPEDGGTRIGINNAGARGLLTAEPYDSIRSKILEQENA